MLDALLEGLLGCDIVGFLSSLDVRNFLLTCEENAGLQVDERERAVFYGGRAVYARHYPISIDVGTTSRLPASRGGKRPERDLAAVRPPRPIPRLHPTYPAKHISPAVLSYLKHPPQHPQLPRD